MITHPPEETRTNPKPSWLKVAYPSQPGYFEVSAILKNNGLNTICRSAKCPNTAECWSHRTATFLILGNVCTRACTFCAVQKGAPGPLDEDEPRRVAEAAAQLGLAHVVVTSVTRDDLTDGGAAHFARTIQAVRTRLAGAGIEALIPDFGGDDGALRIVLRAAPDVLNHNLETTEAQYPKINRPAGNYRRSLAVLRTAKAEGLVTKSGLMIGAGEAEEDLVRTFADLRGAGCDLLTLGQYLQPTRAHAPVVRYYPPDEFARLRDIALGFGFAAVESGPLVRSSFHAHTLYDSVKGRKGLPCDT